MAPGRAAWRRAATAWLAGLMLAACAHAQVETLQQASAITQTREGTRQASVTLPYHWDRRHPGQAGTATFEIAFDLARAPDGPMALYLPRVGNAYELWVNGALVQRNGDLERDDGSDYAKLPRLAEIPADLLAAHNLLHVRIRADAGRRAGLGRVQLGPADEVTDRYERAYLEQAAAALAIMLLSLLVAAIALALWLTQANPQRRRRDPLYLFVCVAELGWALRVADSLIPQPPLPWPAWSMLMAFAISCWVSGMVVFCSELAGWTRRPWGRHVPMAVLAWPALGVAAAGLGFVLESAQPLTAFYAATALIFLPFSAAFCRSALRQDATSGHRVLAVATVINAFTGLRDVIAFRLGEGYGDAVTWTRYSSVLFGLSLAYIVIMRFRAKATALQELLASLATQVAQKEGELRDNYARLEQLAREQERTAERSRILRDMHDGVGSYLSSAIRQLQSGKAESAQVLQTLRDGLEQLKLSIDAMNLPAGDITGLLAGLRYRLEPRLRSSDLALEWQVDEIPPMPRLDSAAMRHLQFMVFEALSNALQHAQARVLRIHAHATDQGACVRIGDDGRGFDAAAAAGAGLRSMRERAAAIGARLTLRSEPGGTCVEIEVPA